MKDSTCQSVSSAGGTVSFQYSLVLLKGAVRRTTKPCHCECRGHCPQTKKNRLAELSELLRKEWTMSKTRSLNLCGDLSSGPRPLSFVECGFPVGGGGSAILLWETMSLYPVASCYVTENCFKHLMLPLLPPAG